MNLSPAGTADDCGRDARAPKGSQHVQRTSPGRCCLKTVDAHTFGRRNPVQTHERSKAEPLYAALLVVLHDLDKITPVIREIDPAVDEQLLQAPAHA